MADWVDITDAQVDPDAPITSELGYAFRDNVVAMTEGASGAPRIQDSALGTNATNAGKNWVNNRYAMSAPRDLGSYVMATEPLGTHPLRQPGDIVSGVSLRDLNAPSGFIGVGQWMCAGYIPMGDTNSAALFRRVS